jgi:hypothetical protein
MANAQTMPTTSPTTLAFASIPDTPASRKRARWEGRPAPITPTKRPHLPEAPRNSPSTSESINRQHIQASQPPHLSTEMPSPPVLDTPPSQLIGESSSTMDVQDSPLSTDLSPTEMTTRSARARQASKKK